MGSPVTNITGAIMLTLQALDGNNQILFNRSVPGELFTQCADASFTSNYNINTDPLPLLPDPNNGYPLMGFYLKNNHSTALVTVQWADINGDEVTPIILHPGGILLQFQPTGVGVLSQIMVQSDTANTPIEYAWWATVPA